MTSKEALEYISKEKGIDNITGAVEYNWKLYQPCFQTIEKDLERLENQEKVIKIFRKNFVNNFIDYDIWGVMPEKIEFFAYKYVLSEDEFKLLKEVFDDGE